MQARIKQQLARVDELSLRERVILFVGILVALFVAWDVVLMSPTTLHEKSVQQRIDNLHSQIATLNKSISQLVASRSNNPNAELRVKLETVQADSARLDAQLSRATAGLVPPNQMVNLLEQVLARQHGLRLVSVENEPPQPLLKITDGTDVRTAESGSLYEHGLQIVFQGNYADIMAYLQALEHMKWRFYWDALDLQVKKYPISQVTIRVHTLSLHKGYIGV
ncbi:MAG: hypothetical protein ACYDB9_07490 [Gammaproteobacteria bacterium]